MNPVRQVWRVMSTQRRELAFAALLGAIASASAIALLGASGYLISRAAELPPVLTLTTAAVMVRAFALSRAAFRYVERLVGHDAAFRGLTELRVRVYQRLEQLAPVGTARLSRGDLLGRLVADVDAAMDIPLRVLLPWAQAVLVTVGTAAFLLWLLPPAAAMVALLGVVAIVVSPWLIGAVVRRAERLLAPSKGALTESVMNALDASADFIAFGAVRDVLSDCRERDDVVTRISRQEARSLGLGGGIGTVIQGGAVALALALAIPAVVDGSLPPVWLAVVAFLPLALFDVLGTLPNAAVSYQAVTGSASRLVALDDEPLPVSEPLHPVALPDTFTGIRVDGLRAGWADTTVLHNVDFTVSAGERIAIVGPSGSGKSTIAAVLMGFLEYSGSVRISGVEVRQADGDDVRRTMGMLTQRSHIFDTSIADNIRIGKPNATDDEVWSVLREAHLETWVRTLPNGISTQVGSFGAAMSGGEAQRLALARLLIAHRACVILDEPTEHLDAQTAHDLEGTILDATRQQTTVLITHRLAATRDVDRILVLSGGRMSATGSHDELLAAGGWYAEQWRAEAAQRDMTSLMQQLPIGVSVPT